MTVIPIKPALCAGFLLLGTSLQVAPVFAQDYVDVEAERRAAAQAPLEEASEVAPATSYTGIQPYSGSTTVAQPPVETTAAPITGTDSGSLMLRVQQLEADVRRLNGLLEEATQALQLLEAQSLERYVDLDRRLASGAAAGVDESTGSAGVAPITAASETPATSRAVDAQYGEEAAYRAAYEWYGSGSLMMLSRRSRPFSQISLLVDMRPTPITGSGSFIWFWTPPTLNWRDRTSSCCLINTLQTPRCQTPCTNWAGYSSLKVTASARRSIWMR